MPEASSAERRRLLSAVPLLFLPAAEAERLVAGAPPWRLGAGEFALKKGEQPRHLLIPLKALRETVDGTSRGHALAPFEPVGLYCLLRGETAAASVVAMEETDVCRLDWQALKRCIGAVPGLPAYLDLLATSPAAFELDRSLGELGCTPGFRAALIGRLEPRRWAPGRWLAREGEPPGEAFYAALGTIRAYGADGAAELVPLWVAPNLTWQLWQACLRAESLPFGVKAVTAAEGFAIGRGPLETLRGDFEADFALLSRTAAPAPARKPGEDGSELVGMADLFPAPPRAVRRRRLRYPFVAQADEMECGPACLAMVSQYHGNDLPTRFWSQRMNVGQEGCTLFDMARAAEKAGFITHGLELPDLSAVEAPLFPLIALRSGHFLVVYGARRGRVLVGDPAIGLSEMALSDFKRGFNGVVLMLKPTEAFYRETSPRRPYAQYFALAKGHGFELALIAGASLALTLISMVPAFLSQFIIDDVLGNKDGRLLVIGLIAMALIEAVAGLLSWMRSYYLAFLSARFDFGSSSAFWNRLLSLPYDFFARRHVGDFTRRLGQLESIRRFIVSELIGVFLDLLNLAFYGVVLWLYSPRVAAAVFFCAPLLVLISALFSRRMRRLYNESFRARADQDALVTDQIKGIATIKTLAAEVAARWRFEESLVRALRAEYRFDVSAAALGGLSSFLRSAISLGVMGLAAWTAVQGRMTPGQVIAVSALASGVVAPFRSFAGLWSEIQRLRVVFERLNDVFLAPPEPVQSTGAPAKTRLRGELEFRNVWFRYGGESSDWALKGLSFRILPGQKVAIVGPSGAGKSTVAMLATRLYEPQQGTILIDGRDHREYDRQWLRGQIGLLLQEPNLFHGTLLENIAYGDPQPDAERVKRCAETAGAADFIRAKSGRLDYMITHGGLGLSGGQKQRIAIARTLYADPAALFLDESTSYVDYKGERSILSALRRAFDGRTVVAIAHGRQSALWADFILVVADGRLAECGSHAELLAAKGAYADLFEGAFAS